MKLLWKLHYSWDVERTKSGYKKKYPCDCASFLDFVDESIKTPKLK